ncbi:MAG: AGE family epimerase/isomerase [Ruthenibacterium sp.]
MLDKAFVASHRLQLEKIYRYYKEKLDQQIIPFWEKRVVDPVYGGYFNCFDENGKLYGTEKPGWFIGRTMYTFSYLYNTYSANPKWLEIAQEGRKFLDKATLSDGRFCQMLNRDGTPLKGATSIFTDHFAVKGLYEYIIASNKNSQKDIELARELTEKLFAHINDPQVLENEGIPPHLQKHAICFMTLLVALESKKIFGDIYENVLSDCLYRSLHVFANDEMEAAFEYVGVDGKPCLEGEGRLIDPGHTMESLWFAMRAGWEKNDPAYAKRAQVILNWILKRGWDETYGGFYQYVDVLNTKPEHQFLSNTYVDIPVAWDDKIWWVQAEGLYCLLMSSVENGNEHHFDYFLRLHEFVKRHFMDEQIGEWNSICKRDGQVSSGRKGFELKGPYHVVRCHVQIVQLLEKALQQ